MDRVSLEQQYSKLLEGDMSIISSLDFCLELTKMAEEYINKEVLNNLDLECIDLIIRISNIAYNNTTLDVLPIDDGIYDLLLNKYKFYNPNYQVGAMPILFKEQPQNDFEDNKIMAVHLTQKEKESKLYINDIAKQYTPTDPRRKTMCYRVREPISKRIINTKHTYPELVGTLDKCKFVLNKDAIEKDVFNKPSVSVFERDFIHKCITLGIINTVEEFVLLGELKYDGVSVEADVCGDTIISARSRGDTAEDIATDLTPILGGYKFPNAKNVPKDITFGIKFEAIITKFDLEKMSRDRNKSYKNCRNAIIGLFGSSDAYLYKDYITLIPLATSLDINRLDEIEFLNKYYSSGQYNRYVVMKGNYQSILFQVKQFTESAEIIRKVLPYLIDGVVISFVDPEKIKMLGRVNSVNKYSIAIKFNPKKVRTVFLGYTFSIGKSGDVIPMVHFKPCEFIGTIHSKQTIHSYKRFKELELRKGDMIDIDYVNEVISYVTKPDNEHNRINSNNEPEKFLERCPICGSKIVISESGKSARCPNPNCSERQIMRMVDMIDRLGFKDFSEETIRTLNIKSFKELINITYEKVSVLGPINSMNFMNYVNNLKTNLIEDYKILSAIGFEGMANEKWKVVLHEITIEEIVNMPYNELFDRLIKIDSIGEKIANIICNERQFYSEDLNIILSMNNIINSKGLESKPRIVITGFRDPDFINLLNNNGFDASDSYSLNKNTFCLITNDLNSTSGKMVKANKFNIPIMTKQQFIEENNIKI